MAALFEDLPGHWYASWRSDPRCILYATTWSSPWTISASLADDAKRSNRRASSSATEHDRTGASRTAKPARLQPTNSTTPRMQSGFDNESAQPTKTTAHALSNNGVAIGHRTARSIARGSRRGTGPTRRSTALVRALKLRPTALESMLVALSGGRPIPISSSPYDAVDEQRSTLRTVGLLARNGARSVPSTGTFASAVEGDAASRSITSSRSSLAVATRLTTPSHSVAPATPVRDDEPWTTELGGFWFSVRDGDPRALSLYLKHYSAKKARGNLPTLSAHDRHLRRVVRMASAAAPT